MMLVDEESVTDLRRAETHRDCARLDEIAATTQGLDQEPQRNQDFPTSWSCVGGAFSQ